MRLLISHREAAEYLGISVIALRDLADEGEVPHLRLRDKCFYNPAALERWVDHYMRNGRKQATSKNSYEESRS